ncbi:7437_t:CDS:1 [Scutellospora calospora]|uniref:7437_t:CDS:1 n=1 Tax=Scutellospora calospora TaxID=85575 RepID=A0ACA9L8N8_9GLOM|nr:7437_t:CDS:1 [Scutellospora calospora]
MIQFIHETLLFSSSPTLQHDHETYFNRLIANPPYPFVLSMDDLKPKLKDPPPRPQNSFMLFRNNFNKLHRNEFRSEGLKAEDISKEAKSDWANQPAEVKNFFKLLAKEASRLHKQIYPSYKYNPKNKFNDESESSVNSESFEDISSSFEHKQNGESESINKQNDETEFLENSITTNDNMDIEEYFDMQAYYRD